jgi:ABC-type transporter Mla subunit MlaD
MSERRDAGIRIEITHRVGHEVVCALRDLATALTGKLGAIMATTQEVLEQMGQVNATLQKVQAEVSAKSAELVAKIDELQALVDASGGVSQEIVDKLAETKTLADALDALNPDAPPVEPPVV